MEDLELKIEERLYALNADQLLTLGEFLKVDIAGQPSRRYKVKKLRERFEIATEEFEGDDLQKFLNDVWGIVASDVEVTASSAQESNTHTEIQTTPLVSGDNVKENTKSASKEPPQAADNSSTENTNSNVASTPMNTDRINGAMKELLNLNLRREFKIVGSIGGDSKDRLSFVGLMRQVDNAVVKGYQETEIVDAVIRAISVSTKLKTYLEMMSDITLQKLRQIIRVHYKEKSSTELYQELTNIIQDSKETPQDFLLRALSLRERIIFASKADNAMKYDATLAQSLFTHAVETGLRDETIRNKLRLSLKLGESTDEELMETLNKIVSVEGERQLKLNANRKENKGSLSAITSDSPKQSQEMSKVMSTLDALQAQIAELNAKVQEQSKSCQSSASPNNDKPANEYQRRRKTCKDCEQRNISQCNHCFKCGSSDHLARGCKQRYQGNGHLLPPRDRQ